MAAGGTDTQVIHLVSRVENMKTGQKIHIGNLREDNNRANRRAVAHYKKHDKNPWYIRQSCFHQVIPNLTSIVTFLLHF